MEQVKLTAAQERALRLADTGGAWGARSWNKDANEAPGNVLAGLVLAGLLAGYYVSPYGNLYHVTDAGRQWLEAARDE